MKGGRIPGGGIPGGGMPGGGIPGLQTKRESGPEFSAAEGSA